MDMAIDAAYCVFAHCMHRIEADGAHSSLLTSVRPTVDLAGRIRATYPGFFRGFADPILEWAYGKHE